MMRAERHQVLVGVATRLSAILDPAVLDRHQSVCGFAGRSNASPKPLPTLVGILAGRTGCCRLTWPADRFVDIALRVSPRVAVALAQWEPCE